MSAGRGCTFWDYAIGLIVPGKLNPGQLEYLRDGKYYLNPGVSFSLTMSAEGQCQTELEGRQSYSVVLPCGKPTSTISADTYCSEIPHRDFSQRSEKMTLMTVKTVVEMKMLLVGRLR